MLLGTDLVATSPAVFPCFLAASYIFLAAALSFTWATYSLPLEVLMRQRKEEETALCVTHSSQIIFQKREQVCTMFLSMIYLILLLVFPQRSQSCFTNTHHACLQMEFIP